MRSSFGSRPRRSVTAAARPTMDENYDLKGLNLVAPDQVMPAGETPFAINNRRYADNDSETSVAMRTRRGSIRLSTAVGETVDQQNTGTITGDINLSTDTLQAIPFTAAASGVLTRIELTLKKSINTRGYVIVDVYTGTNGLPALKVGQTSISPNQVAGTYGSVAAYLMDAPTITAGKQYWLVPRHQKFGVGTYSIAKTAGVGMYYSSDKSLTWIAGNTKARFKSYVSTAGFVKGFTKRYSQATPPLTMFAMGTQIYTLANSVTTPTALTGGTIDAASTKVRFINIDERTFWLDGVGSGKLWNGTAAPAAIANAPTALGPPILGMILQNRLLLVPKNDPTRIDFSALYAFDSWPEVNFLYIGRPKSRDWITAMQEFKDQATIFTKETKYTLTGSDIQTFSPLPHVGTKGAISQEATAVGKEAIYFMADDRHIYAWNGTNDVQISKKVYPELKKILDVSKVRLHLFNNQLRIYYNRNPDNEVNRMLLFDIEEGQWYMDTGRMVMGSMEWSFDNNELIEFSSHAGWLFVGERGYSDLGKAIDFKYWTAYKMYGSGAAKDRIKRFRPVVRPAESTYYLNVGKDIDFQNRPQMTPWLVDSGGAQWGSFNWGDGTTYGGSQLIDDTVPMSGRGKHTQFRFEYEGIDIAVQILGYIAMIKSGRPR